MRHTLQTVAKEAGVSKSTVSLAANGSLLVREETRQKVLAACKKLNYYPNAAARALVSQRSRNIGIAFYDVSYITSPAFAGILAGAIEGANGRDQNLILCTTTEREKPTEETYFMKMVSERRIDGLILYDSFLPDEALLHMKDRQFPLVLIERTLPDAIVPAVLADNVEGMCHLTEYLIGLGHRRIGYIAGSPQFSNVVEKLEGYKTALEKCGITYDPELVKRRRSRDAGVLRQSTRELLKASPRPTAIIVDNDNYALALLHAIEEFGLKVPRDMAIAGYNDAAPMASSMKPALTTIKVPFRDLGTNAVHLLVKLMDNEEIDNSQIRLKGELIVRDSCEALQKDLVVL